ncbi:MAG TPA: signal peptide peptidase SppA [Polyangia bacterium]|jgi:protease-4
MRFSVENSPSGGAPRRLAITLLTLAVGLRAAPAAAEHVVTGESPTQGLSIPAGRLVGDFDATALTLNPAGIVLMRGASLVYVHTELDRSGARGIGGDGFFLANQPLFGRFTFGLGLELLRPPRPFRPDGSSQRTTLALAYRLLPGVAVGLAWHHLFASDATGGHGGLDSLELGVTLRPLAHVGLAYVLRDINTPSIDALGTMTPVPRRHDLELAIRPLGDDRLELAGGVEIRGWGEVSPRARLSLRVARGVFLEGDFEAHRLQTLDTDTGLTSTQRDLRASAGLRVDLDHVSAAAFALFGQRRLAGSELHGASAVLKLSTERAVPAWHGLTQVRRVRLKVGDSDREFAQLMLELRDAERDPSVAAVALVLDAVEVGWGRVEEIRGAIARLRARGTRVFAYANELATRTYYLLAGCDKVWLNPAGTVEITGLASRILFYKGSLDKLGIKAEFVKIAEYKSAPETVTRTGLSEPARRQREEMLDDVYARVVATIARDRHLTPARVRALIDGGPMTPESARAAGLVDGLKHRDELETVLAETLGHRVRLRDFDDAPRRTPSWNPARVAVIFVDGDIVDGKSRDLPILDSRTAGGDSVAEAIRAARESSATRAIVLRINSPGGSVAASEEITREVERTRGKKPIVCSMGDVAASGGYHVASLCDRIFAEPSTITGSIGIFTGKLDVRGLAEKLGISAESSPRGAHADLVSAFREWTPAERALIERQLRYSYDRFLGFVATGRKLSRARADELGRGRVWTGAQASARGLVDAYGGLLDAIDHAKARAGVPLDERVVVWPLPEQPRSVIDFLAGFIGEGEARAGSGRAQAAAGLPLPGAVKSLLRAVPPALLVGRPGAALYRLEFELPRD